MGHKATDRQKGDQNPYMGIFPLPKPFCPPSLPLPPPNLSLPNASRKILPQLGQRGLESQGRSPQLMKDTSVYGVNFSTPAKYAPFTSFPLPFQVFRHETRIILDSILLAPPGALLKPPNLFPSHHIRSNDLPLFLASTNCLLRLLNSSPCFLCLASSQSVLGMAVRVKPYQIHQFTSLLTPSPLMTQRKSQSLLVASLALCDVTSWPL